MPETDIKNILVRAPNWIGDAVMCLPALEALKTSYPDARITVLARPWVSPVFFNNPGVKMVIDYDAEGRHRGIAGMQRLIKDVKSHGFDMAVLFQNAFEAALIAFLAKIPVRIGYRRDFRGLLLTHPVNVDSEIKKAHQVFYYLNIINKVRSQESGVRNKIKPKICLTKEEGEWAENFLKGNGIEGNIIVGIAPGASYGPAKMWMSDRFGAVAKKLSDIHKAKIILFGGKGDREVCNDVLNGREGLNLAGKIDLRKSIAVMNRCSLFITNDSGLMHVAAALGIPVIAIFGSTDPNLTGPLSDNAAVIKKDIECSPCFERECRYGHYKCMEMVTADDVYHASMGILTPNAKLKTSNGSTVFLDRDGTVNEDTGYIDSPGKLVPINGAASAIERLNAKGFRVVVITNQSGIGRGYFTKEAVDAVNKRLEEMLAGEGAHLDGIYYCPHHPDDNCECRKPGTGMLEQAKRDLNIDLRRSYVVGDKASDVEIAGKIGAKGILVLTGAGKMEKERLKQKAAYIADDINDAVEWIIKDSDESKVKSF